MDFLPINMIPRITTGIGKFQIWFSLAGVGASRRNYLKRPELDAGPLMYININIQCEVGVGCSRLARSTRFVVHN